MANNSEAVNTAVAVLEQHVEDCESDIRSFGIFGRGFQTEEIKSIDSQVKILLSN